MAKTDTIHPSIKGPHYLSIILFSLLSLSMAGLMTWKQFQEYQAETTPETFQWLLVASLCAAGLLILSLWVVGRLIWKVTRLRRVRNSNEGDIQYLRGELQTGMRELEIQQEMQQAFFEAESSDHMMTLAAELLRAQNISFWHFTRNNTQMDCLNALKSSKGAFEKRMNLTHEQFPSLFRMLLDKECVQYPQSPLTENPEEELKPQALGNLLHYIENNQVKSLLIIPVEIDGEVAGAAWFEHREIKRQWTIRDQNQARFVASIVRMQFYKKLQTEIIDALSETNLMFDNFRNNAHFGMCWFQLSTSIGLHEEHADLVQIIGETALLEEANDVGTQNLILDEAPFLGSPLRLYLPEGLLELFLENNLQVINYEWEHMHNGQREVLMVSLYGICVHEELIGIWLVSNDITTIKEKEWETNSLLNNAAGILTLLDDDKKIVFDSDSILQLGYEQSSRITHDLVAYLYPADIPLVEQALTRLKEGVSIDEELARIRMKDVKGEWKCYQMHLKSLENEAHAEGILVEMHDVEVQMTKMRTLQDQINFLDDLIEYSDEVVMVLDIDGSIVYESRNSKEIIGYAAEEREGKYGFEFFHQTDTEEIERAFVKLKEGKISNHRQDIQFLGRDGRWKDMEFFMTKNEAAQFVARLKDIGASRRASVISENRERLLLTFLNASKRLYLLTNSKGKIKFASGSCSELLGFQADHLIGSSLGKLIMPSERDAFATNIDALVHHEHAQIEMYLHLPTAEKQYKYFLLKSHGHILEKAYSGLLLELEPVALNDDDESSLSLRLDFFQSLANSFPNPLFFIDQHDEIRFANTAVQELLGKSANGRFIDLVEPEGRSQVESWLVQEGASANEIPFKQGEKRKGQIFELKGSKLKGRLIYIHPQNTEEQTQLTSAYELIESLKKEVAQLEEKLNQANGEEALQEKLGAYRSQLNELLDEISQKKEENNQQATMIKEMATQLEEVDGLRMPANELARLFGDTLEVIRKYQEITPDVDLVIKLEEIHNLSELINFEIVLNSTKSYIEQIRGVLHPAEAAKG